MFPRTIGVLAALAATTALACVDSSDGGYVYVGPYTYEVEPNDFYWTAQGLGPMSVGKHFLVRGSVSDIGPDRFDGFAFLATTPMDVEFRLYADVPGADLDVALFDPYTGTTIASWETGSNPECGVFSVQTYGLEFHLVVNSYVGAGAYTLEVCAQPLTWGDGPSKAGLAALGALRPAAQARDWSGYAKLADPESATSPIPWVDLTTLLIDERTGRVLGQPIRRRVFVATSTPE